MGRLEFRHPGVNSRLPVLAGWVVSYVSDPIEVRIVVLHVEDDLFESVQDSDPKRRLEIELASSNAFGHLAFRIGNGVSECGGELAGAVFLDEEAEIMVLRSPADRVDERRSDDVLILIENRREYDGESGVGMGFLCFVTGEHAQLDERRGVGVGHGSGEYRGP